MNKIWTPEQRLEAISQVAYLGNSRSSPDYYWMIGMLTNGSADELNTNEELGAVLEEMRWYRLKNYEKVPC